jgi:hypothetical protein
MAEIQQYPYRVDLPLSKGYISIVEWLESRAITAYDHESFMRGGRPYSAFRFAREADAVLFGLRWS